MRFYQKSADNRPLTWVARIVSLACHPIWLPLVYGILAFWGEPGQGGLLLKLALCSVAFPGIVTLAWMWLRSENDIFVISRPNRIVPLLAGLLGMAAFAVVHATLLPDRFAQGEMVATTILLLSIGVAVTLFWKISLHMMSWGAVNVFVFQMGDWASLGGVMALTLAVAWARMRVKSHDPVQVMAGWATGIVAALVVTTAFPKGFFDPAPTFATICLF